MGKSVLLIGNGENFRSKIFDAYIQKFPIIALDGGANFCRSENITPQAIIGDMDSITPETEKIFRKKGV